MNTDSPFDSIPTDHVVPALLLCDISSIPNEILARVFQLVPSLHALPVTLSHVCRLWRDVALGAPELWANIAIYEEIGVHMTHFLTTLLRVQHCIARSGSHALTLDITILQFSLHYPPAGEPRLSDDYQSEIQKSFNICIRSLSVMLAPHVWRFKSFKLEHDEFSSVVDIQSSFTHVSMPLLEIWEVLHRDEGENVEFFTTVDEVDLNYYCAECTTLSVPLQPRGVGPGLCSVTYPRLRKARLSSTPLDWPRFGPTNLQSLEISYLPKLLCPDGETLRQILLANAHALITLKLHGASPTGQAIEPYVLPNLARLELGYMYPDELIPFVQDANFPSLEYFVIEDVLADDHDNTSLMRNIINHFPLHRMKTVEIRHITFFPSLLQHPPTPPHPLNVLLPDLSDLVVPATIFKFLYKLSSLRNLTLSNTDIAIFNALNHLPPAGRGGYVCGSSLVPCLEVLRLEYSCKDDGRAFLETRIARRSELPNIPQIIFVVEHSDKRDWICEIVRSVDVLSITKRFEYLEKNSSFHLSLSR
jgi:hypothetical protein